MLDNSRVPSPLAVMLVLLAFLTACPSDVPDLPPSRHFSDGRFTEITDRIKLPRDGDRWPDGAYFVPEIMGAGVALLDYDGDGDLDLLQARFPPPGRAGDAAANRLFRQQPDGSFVDATSESGLGDPGYGQGIAVGDVNNDGAPDVYFANFGPDALYLNRSDGTFVRAPPGAGYQRDRWSSAATFCDIDRDGDLDLFVAHYLRYRYQERCAPGGTGEDYCSPTTFAGEADSLFLNDGSGKFTEVTTDAGIGVASPVGKGLGVVCVDLTQDGWPDIYVANDGEMNHLWVNRADGSFVEEAMLRGVAVNRQGSPEASMGLAVGDVDGDGIVDLFMSHLARETNTLYRGNRNGQFHDRSVESGLSSHDLALTGFGCGFLDYDQDGDLDLAVVNGRIQRGPVVAGADLDAFWNRYAEPNLLFDNDGTGLFSNASANGGAFTARVEVSRGLAIGDLDGDGDPDLLLSNADGALRLFRNDAPDEGSHWIQLRAISGKRDALGARLTVVAGGRSFVRWLLPGSSYQSSNDPRVHFGLGPIDSVERVDVLWPDGSSERFVLPSVDGEFVLRAGSGVDG